MEPAKHNQQELQSQNYNHQQDDFPFPYQANPILYEKPQKNQNNLEFQITVQHSQKSLDQDGAKQNDKAKLIQYSHHGGPNQIFLIEQPKQEILKQQGYIHIKIKHSQKYLDIEDPNKQGSCIIQNSYTGKDSQLFQLLQQKTHNHFVIKNKQSNMVLDVCGGSHNDCAQIIHWPMHCGPNQVFQISEN